MRGRKLSQEWRRIPNGLNLEDRILVKIEDQSSLDDDDKKKLQNFNWTLSSLTQTSMTIDLDFKYPEMIGYGNSSQYVEVYARFSDFEPMWNDSKPLIRKIVPNQMSYSTSAETALKNINTFGDSSTTVTIVNSIV